MNLDTIKHCIDKISIIDKKIIVDGWAYAEYMPKVEINVPNANGFTLEVVKRTDIYNIFDEQEEALNSGFRITLDYKKQFIIMFVSGKEKVEQHINLKKYFKKESKLKKVLKLINLNNIMRILRFIRNYGIRATIFKIKEKINRKCSISGISYDEWYRKKLPCEEELESQRNHKFEYRPKISIVVPTYNTKENFLVEMIESVVKQTYDNWELCIADGASSLKECIETLKRYNRQYDNIKVRFLDKNYMISGNTNEALALATGDYIGLFDHDDLLTEDALYEVVKVLNVDRTVDFIYSDEDKTDENSEEFFDPHFKPDWSPDTLRSYNYITHFTVFSKSLLDKVGNFDSEYDGSQDYDMFLRLTEKAQNIFHISKILYHWRVHRESTAGGIGAKSYALVSAKKALQKHLERIGELGTVKDGKYLSSYKVDYKIIGTPKVSIIIPNKDEVETLKKCINSILKKTTYNNYEIIIVENNSKEERTFKYYNEISKKKNIEVIVWKDKFNYSAINNYAVKNCSGEFVLLLNNDVEIISAKWIDEMLMYCQRKEVGIVGAKLYYPDDTVQHAGVILGIGGVAGHSHKYFNRFETGFVGRLKVVQNLSAVTAACLMVKRSVYEEVGGLDETFTVAFNDVDFCMKVQERGYNCIFNPYVELYHYESKSRGAEDTPEKVKRFQSEIERFEDKWGLWIRDPYYNENLTLEREDFSLKEQ